MADQRITVAVRIRPPINRERYEPVCARKADDGESIVIKPEENAANMGEPSVFHFDYTFDETDDQRGVYEESVQELVDHALSGNNATVFTYGQTGSGKTYTILGDMDSQGTISESSGVFLRVFDDLFSYKAATQNRVRIMFTLSAIELYVEDVMDLLASKRKLKLRETPEETIAQGIRTVEITDMSEVVKTFSIANSFRSVTATKMNDTSSRSHALFFIDIYQIPVEQCPGEFPPLLDFLDPSTGLPISGKVAGLVRSRIALVDLAGSERVKRSGVEGAAMVEAQAINKSLSTLGTVINAMYVKNPHVPFRESKLTKMLKNSFLDPTSRLLLIGQVAPPTVSASESLGTLRFCDRVKGLQAGAVSVFDSPEEEESFLQSLRLTEELHAEMHILDALYAYAPANYRQLAALRGTSVSDAIATATQQLRQDAPNLEARQAAEDLKSVEIQAAGERDKKVEEFVLHMNAMIEDYEEVARNVKKEKKAAKKLKEERDAQIEEQTHEVKKMKKSRGKQDEHVEQVRGQLAEAAAAEKQVDESILDVQRAPVSEAEGNGPQPDDMERAAHETLECFYNHAAELNRLYGLYTHRLQATQRQRSEVRRMKMLSSSIFTDGTMLYDVLAFLVKRAVDIGEGHTPLTSRWTWDDIDGQSQHLLNARELFPPLLRTRREKRSATRSRPCAEEGHAITFLSSDDSDGVNSHHAAESRRQRVYQGSDGTPYKRAEEEESSEGEEDEEEEHGAKEEERPPSKVAPRESNWFSGELEGPADAVVVNTVPAVEVVNKHHHTPDGKPSRRHRTTTAADAPSSSAKANGEANTDSGTPSPAREPGLRGVTEDEMERDARNLSEDLAAEGDVLSPNAEGERRDKKKRRKHHRHAAEEGGEAGAEVSPPPPATGLNQSFHDDAPAGEVEGAGVIEGFEHVSDGSSTEGSDEEGEMEAPPVAKEEEDQRYLMKVYDSPTLVQDLIKFLRGGTTMLKHGRIGKPHRRLFWVSTARGSKELLWMPPDARNSDRSSISLNDVSSIQLGCFSKVFRRHKITPENPAFFRCFSIVLKKNVRTIDIVADTTPDYEAWVVGLSHLVGVDPEWGGKLCVAKQFGFERLTFFESSLCEANYIYPSHYLTLKKAVQKMVQKVIQTLQECQNNAAKAHSILGGIHQPAVNDRGAIYLTKGELRFLVPELKFDIFRISRLWILFSNMNLIFDDHFLPATAFGVSHRQ